MKHIKSLSIFLILVGMVSCIGENHNLKNSDFNIACAVIAESQKNDKDRFKLVYKDSVGFFDIRFHAENLIYVSNILFQNSSLNIIEYYVFPDENERVLKAEKERVELSVVWLQNHKGYVRLFEFLKTDKSFRYSGSLVYSHILSLIDDQNIFNENIYELYKMAFSTVPEEKRFAMETLEKLREEIAKNEKFGTPENIARYDHIVELIVRYNN